MTYAKVRRALRIVVAVDAGSVVGILIVAITRPQPDASFAYVAVGAAGWILAFVAVRPLARTHPQARTLLQLRSRGLRLVFVGLGINTLGCVALLVLAPSSNGLGLYLLVGGDALSVAYIGLFAELRGTPF